MNNYPTVEGMSSISKEKNICKSQILYGDGSVYVGEYIDSVEGRNGRGILVCENKSKYEGLWKKDMPNGKGKLIYPNGDFYIGEWRDGKANEQRKLVHLSGSE